MLHRNKGVQRERRIQGIQKPTSPIEEFPGNSEGKSKDNSHTLGRVLPFHSPEREGISGVAGVAMLRGLGYGIAQLITAKTPIVKPQPHRECPDGLLGSLF